MEISELDAGRRISVRSPLTADEVVHIATYLQLPVNERLDRDIRVRGDHGRRQYNLPVACIVDPQMETFDP